MSHNNKIIQSLRTRASGIPYYWIVLIVATGAQMTVSFVAQGVATLAPFFVSDLGVSRAQVGFLGGAINVGMAFTSLLAGVLVDHLGEKVVLTAGGLLTGITVLTASRANSFQALAILLMLTGFWAASATPAGSKGIMAWFPLNWRGFALGFRQTGLPMGGFLSALILPAIAMLYGWRGALVVAGAIPIAGALFALIFYREGPGMKKQEQKAGGSRLRLRQLLRRPELWLISAAALTLVGIQFTVVAYLELFYHEGLGHSVRFASYMLALAQVGGMLGRLFWGFISDRLFGGYRKKPFLLVAMLTAMMCLAMIFVGPAVPSWFLAILSWLLGFTAIGWNGLFIAMVSELAGGNLAGTALGIALTVIQFGVLTIPPSFGAIVDRTGSYRDGWLVLLGICLAGICLLSRVQEKKAEPVCN